MTAMACNYPDCDGGSATGYCHSDCCDYRIVACDACGTEGVVLRGHPNDPNPIDCGPCPACEGQRSIVVEVEPIEMEDLDRD